MTTYPVDVALGQIHIAEGVRGDPYRCPMACALEDETGQWGNCWVGFRTARVTIPGERTMYAKLPEKARQWSVAFNDGVTLGPITFTLEFIEWEGGD